MSKNHLDLVVRAYYESSETTQNSNYMSSLLRLSSLLYEMGDSPMRLDEECKHYTYVYLNPEKPGSYEYLCPSGKVVKFKYEPFYVGKGFGRRSKKHITDAKNPSMKGHRLNVIRRLTKKGLRPIIKQTSSLWSNTLACAFEIDLILGIGRRDLCTGPLANLTAGGEGSAVMSQHTKDKISRAHAGKTLTAAHSKAIGDALRGRQMSKADIDKWVASRAGYKHSAETRDKIRIAATGRKRSDESRRNQSNSTKGVPKTAAHNAAVSAALKGLKKGVPWSETRRRLFEARKAEKASQA